MAVKRAVLFPIGPVGLICAAYEVAIEGGTETRKGTVRPIRDCSNPTTVVIERTGLCDDCGEIFASAIEAGTVGIAENLTGRAN